jgi:hypothetical protein
LLELEALDPFDSTDVPLRVTLLEYDTLSSFADVPLSPPQAARAMERRNVRKNRMDPLRFASRMTGRERHFAFASDFLILYSFPSIYPI